MHLKFSNLRPRTQTYSIRNKSRINVCNIYIFIHRQVAQNKKNEIQKIKKQRLLNYKKLNTTDCVIQTN